MLHPTYIYQALKIPSTDWESVIEDSRSVRLNLGITEETVILGIQDPNGIQINNKKYRPSTGLAFTKRKQLPYLGIDKASELLSNSLLDIELGQDQLSQIRQVSLLLRRFIYIPNALDDTTMLINEIELLYTELGTLYLPKDFLGELESPISFTKLCAPNIGKYIAKQLEEVKCSRETQ